MSLKWFAVGGVVTACLAYLIFAATGTSAEYYQTISEMRSHPSTKNVRVIGTVQDDVVRSEGGLRVQFTASDGAKVMPVDYRGTVPDIFRPGIQVVVEGRMESDGVFHAKAMEAKCPSRFSISPPAAASTG